jgi:arylsulfatase A-like enzyme
VIAFEVPRVYARSGERPRRPRGIGLSSFLARPLGERGRPSPPARAGTRLWLPPHATASVFIRPPSAASLQVAGRGAGRGPARLSIARDRGAGPSPLLSLDLEGEAVARASADGLPGGEIARLELASVGGEGLWLERLALSHAPQLPTSPAPLPGRPSLVIYLADALRADRLGAYGHAAPTSPRFDAFAREALLFADAWAQSSWTRPALASIFTGLTPTAHAVSGLRGGLAADLVTLAEVLERRGRRTGAFVANAVVTPRLGFAQGFGTWNGPRPEAVYGKPGRTVVERALGWLDGARGPFFLYVHTMEAHGPYGPEPEHWAPFRPPGYRGNTDTGALARKPAPSGEELRFLDSAYQGEVRQGDAAFGLLLDGLRQRRLLDEAVVVFVSDHGEALAEHGGTGHGGTLYQEVLRIPLAVRLPGARRGGVRESRPVQQADLTPTLLSLLGAPLPQSMEGRDLSAWWRDGLAPQDDPVLLSRLQFGDFEEHDKAAVRVGRFKLVVNHGAEGRAGEKAIELYDLVSDPRESKNLAASHAVARGYLERELRRAEAQALALRHRLRAGHDVPLTGEERERLRALGYVE